MVAKITAKCIVLPLTTTCFTPNNYTLGRRSLVIPSLSISAGELAL